MKRLALLLPLLALVPLACGASKANCADTVAHALTSPSAPVAGSFRCLSANLQSEERASGRDGDKALQTIAQEPPVATSYTRVGQTADGRAVYVFEGLDQATGKPISQVVVLHLDQHGQVDRIQAAL